jgi:hypothetical protein
MAELVSRIKPTHQYIFILNIYEKLPQDLHPAQPQIQKLGITHILTRFHNKILISRSGSHLLTLAGDTLCPSATVLPAIKPLNNLCQFQTILVDSTIPF